MADSVLKEVLHTEQTYVHDLTLLVTGFVAPLRAESVLSKDEEAQVFSNCEMILGVNQELAGALLAASETAEPVGQVAAAFSRMAPFLRCCIPAATRTLVFLPPRL